MHTAVTYLTDPDQKPVGYNPPIGAGEPRREGRYDQFTVAVHDARPIAGKLSLDVQGFTLVRRPSAVRDFFDADEVRRVYYPEVVRLIVEATGAAKVVVFDHTVRVGAGAVERGARAPVPMVHNDYTETSAPRRVRDLLPAAEAEARLKHRFVEINVWRPIAGPVLANPLGIVDASTIAPRDLVVADLVYADRKGEIFYGAYNPNHRWHYVPAMERDEAILIKCYDSARDGRARFSLHAAFADPTTPADAPPRESIEARAFAFFDA
ncbi:MAG: CmcJ/NvfI family oxidoreductase [Alphaproteobacteria bacterium]